VNNLNVIAETETETEGVDGGFFGPDDLLSSMDHRCQPEVQKVIRAASPPCAPLMYAACGACCWATPALHC